MAAEASYDGGIGGKFRRRPARRPAPTPYDRPLPASRSVRASPRAGDASGWISRLVDPASRLITSGASKLFSSVFGTRVGASLTPTLPAPEASASTIEGTPEPEEISIDPPSAVKIQGGIGEISKEKFTGGFSEVEQLLKQKTFTRVEFDRLSGLLRSRTLDLPAENANGTIELSKTEKPDQFVKSVTGNQLQKDEIEGQKLYRVISEPAADLNHPGREVASPTDLAKAYMGYKTTTLSMPTLSFQSPTVRDATPLLNARCFVPKSSDVSSSPKSTVRMSGVYENDTITPRPHGRSAIYRMSRSPYFNAQSIYSNKDRETSGDVYARHPPSQHTPQAVSISGGKQELKRRSSVLDNDIGSFGPIRRIRQKSYCMPSPPKKIPPSETALSAYLAANGYQGSLQIPLQLEGVKPSSDKTEEKEENVASTSFSSVHQHSGHLAMKILKHLDHMVPSPIEKFPEIKPIARDGSPSKMTLSMLNEHALKSVKDIDSFRICSLKSSGTLDDCFGSSGTEVTVSASLPEDRLEKGPMQSAPLQVKLLSEAQGADIMAVSMDYTQPAKSDSPPQNSAAAIVQKRSFFQMLAPESSWELDAADDGGAKDSSMSVIDKERGSMITVNKPDICERSLKKPFDSSSDKWNLISVHRRDAADNNGFNVSSLHGNENGFTFPVSSTGTDFSKPPPTPTMPAPLHENSVSQKEIAYDESALLQQTTPAPVFNFGSVKAPTSTSSTTTDIFAVSTDQKKSSSKTASTVSSAISTTVLFAQENDGLKDVESSRSLQISTVPVSVPATSGSSVFTGLPALDMTSGSFISSSSSVFSGNSTGIISSKTEGTPVFAFGARNGSTSVLTDSVATPPVQSDSKEMESKSVKGVSFGSANFSSAAASSLFSTSKNDDIGSIVSALSSTSGSTSGLLFGSQSGSGNSISPQTSAIQFGSSISSPVFGSDSSVFAFSSASSESLTSGTKPLMFGSSSGSGQSLASFSTETAPSNSSGSSSFAPSFNTPSIFSSSSQAAVSPIFGSAASNSSSGSSFVSSVAAPSLFSSTSQQATPIFGSNMSNSSSSLSFASSVTSASIFSSSCQPATASIFGSSFSSAAASTPGFSFGLLPASSGGSLSFGSSSGPAFSFTSSATAAASAPSPTTPAFGLPAPITFGATSPGNDQMNMEDSMTDDTVQTVSPGPPLFGQPANPSLPPNLNFSAAPLQAGGAMGFQFGSSPQVPVFPQSQPQFQPSGSLEFNPGGSFSLGSGGGDKSSRRIVKVQRNKLRRK